MSPLEIFLLAVILGWGVNWIAVIASTLSDIYWGNQNIAQGIIACAAFAWVPYFVFLAGMKHFLFWSLRISGR